MDGIDFVVREVGHRYFIAVGRPARSRKPGAPLHGEPPDLQADVDHDVVRGQTDMAFRSPSVMRPMGETGSR